MVGFFLDKNYVNFFGGSDSIYQDLSKKDFFEILVIFLDRAKILDRCSDKSLILGNQLEPIKRYPYFLPILMVFGL